MSNPGGSTDPLTEVRAALVAAQQALQHAIEADTAVITDLENQLGTLQTQSATLNTLIQNLSAADLMDKSLLDAVRKNLDDVNATLASLPPELLASRAVARQPDRVVPAVPRKK